VPAGLVALGDDQIGVTLVDSAGVLDVADEEDDLAAGGVDLIDEGGRVAESGGEDGDLHAGDRVELILGG